MLHRREPSFSVPLRKRVPQKRLRPSFLDTYDHFSSFLFISHVSLPPLLLHPLPSCIFPLLVLIGAHVEPSDAHSEDKTAIEGFNHFDNPQSMELEVLTNVGNESIRINYGCGKRPGVHLVPSYLAKCASSTGKFRSNIPANMKVKGLAS